MAAQSVQGNELFERVRAKVRSTLLQSQAYQQLPLATQRAIAHDTVKAMAFIVGAAEGGAQPTSVQLSGDSPIVRQLADPPPPEGETAGTRFAASGAVATQQGAEALADTIERVDFPKFVAGLIDGVFNAIVTSSIKQMEAYADLVANVAKSVDQYMKDNVTENNARDYLTERYPEALELNFTDEGPKLKPRDGLDENSMPDFQSDLGMSEPLSSLDEETAESQLMPAARRRIALDRQQLLATMVMMGVNRLVVTNGLIEASCLFEVNTRDEVKRKFQRKSTSDWRSEREAEWGSEGSSTHRRGFLGLGGRSDNTWFTKGASASSTAFNVTTTRSEDSTAKVDMHAKLTGKVNLNFKSDYFPMQRMVDVMQIDKIRAKTPNGNSAESATPSKPGKPPSGAGAPPPG